MSNLELIPAILIVLPLAAATLPMAATVLRRTVGWTIAVAVLAVETILAAWLGYRVLASGDRIVHHLGGFGRPGPQEFALGIELVADPLSVVLVLLVAMVSFAVLAFARSSGPGGNRFYAAYLLLSGALMGVALTGDLFNLFVFLEIAGLATYTLVASARSAEAAMASLKYLIIGTTGASVYLVGVGYLFLATGSLNMVDVSRTLAGDVELAFVDGAMYGDPLVGAAFGFIAIGLAVKAALFPLHVWQPDAYQHAPDAVTVYISALVSTLAAYALLRICVTVFTPAFFATRPLAIEGLLLLGTLSLIAGSGVAATRSDLKRMFAYSSVAQFGLVVVAIGIAVHPAAGGTARRFAIVGAVIHLVGHGITKAGLFAGIGVVRRREGRSTIAGLSGLADRQPVMAAVLAILGLSLVGVPPTVGLVSKWYILLGAASAQLWVLVAAVAGSTLLTLLYVARLLERAYFTPETSTGVPVAADGGTAGAGPGIGMIAVPVFMAILAVGLGFAGADVAAALDPLVDALLTGSPEVGPHG